MGYSTDFIGSLKFTNHPNEEMWDRLNCLFGQDVRNHPDWKIPYDSYFYYIDIEPTKNNDGLQWDGSEKSYSMEKQFQFVIDYMKESFPDFGLIGYMEAQGEEVEDHWFLVADGNTVNRIELEDFYTNWKKRITSSMSGESSNIEVSIS